MLKHLSVLREKLVQHRFAVILVSAPKDVMVGAGDDLDRVELHEPQAADQCRCVKRSGGSFSQPI